LIGALSAFGTKALDLSIRPLPTTSYLKDLASEIAERFGTPDWKSRALSIQTVLRKCFQEREVQPVANTVYDSDEVCHASGRDPLEKRDPNACRWRKKRQVDCRRDSSRPDLIQEIRFGLNAPSHHFNLKQIPGAPRKVTSKLGAEGGPLTHGEPASDASILCASSKYQATSRAPANPRSSRSVRTCLFVSTASRAVSPERGVEGKPPCIRPSRSGALD
jgi:hypothetical protein